MTSPNIFSQPSSAKKQTILIVDDGFMNRAVMSDMLSDTYDILEAQDGLEAIALVQRYGTTISLILLDLVMPHMDGFEVLEILNERGWIHEIPVIMVSAEESPDQIDRAFHLGATDFLSRNFNRAMVNQRVRNTLIVDAKQKVLIEAVSNEIYRHEKDTNLMVNILSHIVEFRNGESGMHVLHVNTMTELLLKRIAEMTDKYRLDPETINLITLASSLHDIGKISIDDAILNKPGRLTDEEFALMKQHTVIGSEMLSELPYDRKDEPLIEISYQICRWHHERYDGRGYPDGLKGDEIPISAQVVALADVYDALTSERVYKDAYSHEKSLQMIMNGECGCFNPLLLECLQLSADDIQEKLNATGFDSQAETEIRRIIDDTLGIEGGISVRKSQALLDFERMKYQFFASMSNEMQFEYMVGTDMLTIDDWSEGDYVLPPAVPNPRESEILARVFGAGNIEATCERIKDTTPEEPVIQTDFVATVKGHPRWLQLTARTIWADEESPRFEGVIGKVVDVHERHEALKDLEYKAAHDELTGLKNRSYASEAVAERMEANPDTLFVIMVFDLDNFKDANDQRGHLFGDKVLQSVSSWLRRAVRDRDVVARVGGDEFLVCMECSCPPEPLIKRVFKALSGDVDGFSVSVSMGVDYAKGSESTYEEMFQRADEALYIVKHAGRGGYAVYDEVFSADRTEGYRSALSQID